MAFPRGQFLVAIAESQVAVGMGFLLRHGFELGQVIISGTKPGYASGHSAYGIRSSCLPEAAQHSTRTIHRMALARFLRAPMPNSDFIKWRRYRKDAHMVP